MKNTIVVRHAFVWDQQAGDFQWVGMGDKAAIDKRGFDAQGPEYHHTATDFVDGWRDR